MNEPLGPGGARGPGGAGVAEPFNREPSPAFTKWVKSLPEKHWAKYDLSACRLGWEGLLGTFPESIRRIMAERLRQIAFEGYDAAHDDEHDRGELIDAGLSYIRAAINVGHPAMQEPPQAWPWDEKWWKPSGDRIRNLEKAAALIAAEIDRLLRLRTQCCAEPRGFVGGVCDNCGGKVKPE